MIRGNGDVFHCCLQTTPFMNWREENINPDEHPRHHEIIKTIENNEIPFECSASHCIYVKGDISDDNKPSHASDASLLVRYDDRKIGKGRTK
jgi:hypothetical protein